MESIEKAIIEKIEEMREDIIYFHKQIIQIPSENPPGKYKQIAQFVQNKFEELGLKTFVKRNNVVGKY